MREISKTRCPAPRATASGTVDSVTGQPNRPNGERTTIATSMDLRPPPPAAIIIRCRSSSSTIAAAVIVTGLAPPAADDHLVADAILPATSRATTISGEAATHRMTMSWPRTKRTTTTIGAIIIRISASSSVRWMIRMRAASAPPAPPARLVPMTMCTSCPCAARHTVARGYTICQTTRWPALESGSSCRRLPVSPVSIMRRTIRIVSYRR